MPKLQAQAAALAHTLGQSQAQLAYEMGSCLALPIWHSL